jgi:hypothetical protein
MDMRDMVEWKELVVVKGSEESQIILGSKPGM